MTTLLADQVFDVVRTHVRKHLAEYRGRTRFELELFFADLRNKIARILEEANHEEIKQRVQDRVADLRTQLEQG